MTGRRGSARVVPRLVLRTAVALLPPSLRDRYREEWTADVDGAAEVGMSADRVALGALVGAVRIAAAPGGPVPDTARHRRVGRVPAAVGGLVAGALVGTTTAFAVILLAGSHFQTERQQEGTLVVAMLAGAVLGATLGRTAALRVTAHPPSHPLVPVVAGSAGACGALYLLGAVVPPDVLDTYGLVLLPVTLVLAVVGSSSAGELLAARPLRRDLAPRR